MLICIISCTLNDDNLSNCVAINTNNNIKICNEITYFKSQQIFDENKKEMVKIKNPLAHEIKRNLLKIYPFHNINRKLKRICSDVNLGDDILYINNIINNYLIDKDTLFENLLNQINLMLKRDNLNFQVNNIEDVYRVILNRIEEIKKIINIYKTQNKEMKWKINYLTRKSQYLNQVSDNSENSIDMINECEEILNKQYYHQKMLKIDLFIHKKLLEYFDNLYTFLFSYFNIKESQILYLWVNELLTSGFYIFDSLVQDVFNNNSVICKLINENGSENCDLLFANLDLIDNLQNIYNQFISNSFQERQIRFLSNINPLIETLQSANINLQITDNFRNSLFLEKKIEFDQNLLIHRQKYLFHTIKYNTILNEANIYKFMQYINKILFENLNYQSAFFTVYLKVIEESNSIINQFTQSINNKRVLDIKKDIEYLNELIIHFEDLKQENLSKIKNFILQNIIKICDITMNYINNFENEDEDFIYYMDIIRILNENYNRNNDDCLYINNNLFKNINQIYDIQINRRQNFQLLKSGYITNEGFIDINNRGLLEQKQCISGMSILNNNFSFENEKIINEDTKDILVFTFKELDNIVSIFKNILKKKANLINFIIYTIQTDAEKIEKINNLNNLCNKFEPYAYYLLTEHICIPVKANTHKFDILSRIKYNEINKLNSVILNDNDVDLLVVQEEIIENVFEDKSDLDINEVNNRLNNVCPIKLTFDYDSESLDNIIKVNNENCEDYVSEAIHNLPLINRNLNGYLLKISVLHQNNILFENSINFNLINKHNDYDLLNLNVENVENLEFQVLCKNKENIKSSPSISSYTTVENSINEYSQGFKDNHTLKEEQQTALYNKNSNGLFFKYFNFTENEQLKN